MWHLLEKTKNLAEKTQNFHESIGIPLGGTLLS